MMFDSPVAPYEINDEVVAALNKLLILHGDHEQNCSTQRCDSWAAPGQPVCLNFRRHLRPVGPPARRRQPGGHGYAGVHSA